MTITTTIKSIQDIMRQDAGVDGDAQRISQLVWMLFWTSDPYRTTVFIACAGLLALHVTAVTGGATGRRRRIGALLAGLATFVAIPAAAALAFGFEPLISAMNDEVLVLPAMMSRVLGITGYLDIPTDLPKMAMAAAAVLGAAAIVIALQGRSRRPTN